jgi:hypothetical protein
MRLQKKFLSSRTVCFDDAAFIDRERERKREKHRER